MDYLADDLFEALRAKPRRWLVTGAAGFIGSNLVECLVGAGQEVIGLDNFSTGNQRNIDEAAGQNGAGRLRMIEADIRDRAACETAVEGVDIVLHQAALGSVPRSIAEPLESHDTNVTGFLNVLEAARTAGATRFIYAASSATYGDEPTLPKVEERIGNPLSPYAATKLAMNHRLLMHSLRSATGLRDFHVFGPSQDPRRLAALSQNGRAMPATRRWPSTATARPAATSVSLPMRCRPISAPRSLPTTSRARFSTSRSASAPASTTCSH